MEKRIIESKNAPAPIGPYNQAVLSGSTLYLSGQIAIDPLSQEFVNGSVEEQTNLVMSNLKAVLNEADMGFENVVKSTIYVTDLNDFTKVNAIYGDAFVINPPARETVQVAALPKGAKVEISMIALK